MSERTTPEARLLVLAGESCGGRWVSGWLRDAGGLDVTHYSWPHGPDDEGDRRFPAEEVRQWCMAGDGALLVVVRDPTFVAPSAVEAHPTDREAAAMHVVEAVSMAAVCAADYGTPVRLVTYEALCAWPGVLAAMLGYWLGVGVLPVPEVVDGNARRVREGGL